MNNDDVMTAAEAAERLAEVAPRRVCVRCGAVNPETRRLMLGADAIDVHTCASGWDGRVDEKVGRIEAGVAARALRSVVALHKRVEAQDRYTAGYMRGAWAFGVDSMRRAAAVALRPVLPDAWERLRDVPDPGWPSSGVEPATPDCAPYLAGWLAGAEAAREEAAETCDAWALLHHPTLRSTIAATLAARIRALPPAAPPPPREGAVRAPDGGGAGEGSPDAPEGAAEALAGDAFGEAAAVVWRMALDRDRLAAAAADEGRARQWRGEAEVLRAAADRIRRLGDGAVTTTTTCGCGESSRCYLHMSDGERRDALRCMTAALRSLRSPESPVACDAFAAPAHNPGARVVPTGGGR